MACGDTSIGLTYEECIVQAENAEEIRACNDNTLGITVEECIVQAESAEEIADCKSD